MLCMKRMVFGLAAAVFALGACLSACSPTLNWREVRMEGTALVAMMPCKPDRVVRTVPFVGGVERSLTMLTCEAGGGTFAITMADMGDASQTTLALAQWDAATRAHLRMGKSAEQAMSPAGASPNAQAKVVVGMMGLQTGKEAMRAHMAYFAKGSQIFQAVLYAPVNMGTEAVETFLTGLALP
jgi:hypothetical protein